MRNKNCLRILTSHFVRNNIAVLIHLFLGIEKKSSATVVVLLALCSTSNVHAESVIYDQRLENSESVNIGIGASPGERITVNILNTCEGAAISAHGIRDQKETEVDFGRTSRRLGNKPSVPFCDSLSRNVHLITEKVSDETCFLADKTINIVHKAEYSSYLVDISLPNNPLPSIAIEKNEFLRQQKKAKELIEETCDTKLNLIDEEIRRLDSVRNPTENQLKLRRSLQVDGEKIVLGSSSEIQSEFEEIEKVELSSTRFIVNVRENRWNTDFSGGVVVSSLTDQEFGSVEIEGINIIERKTNLEDKQSLILGAFTHVYHSDWSNSIFGFGTPALTAGISVTDGSELDYMIGPSIKFGDAVLNIGYHWGSAKRLSRDFASGQEISIDPGELKQFSSESTEEKIDHGFFFSISFIFAGQGKAPIVSRLAFPDP